MATIDDFAKIEMRVGKVLTAEKVPDTDKLLKLSVDFGTFGIRQVISGIALYVPDPMLLVGMHIGFVTNLEPRIIKGLESQAMILAGHTEEGVFSPIGPLSTLPPGTLIK